MINSVVLVGRLTKDIELRKTSNNISTCTFTVACDKRFKPTQEGAPTADFIQCVIMHPRPAPRGKNDSSCVHCFSLFFG